MDDIVISKVALELLSAGVIAALVTGVFSLIISIKNNKMLLKLEKIKHDYSIEENMYHRLIEAYDELQKELPDDKLVGHFVMNMPSRKNFASTGISDAYPIAEESMRVIFTHFQKYKYVFSKKDQESFMEIIGELDEITKTIISIQSTINSNNVDDETASSLHQEYCNRIVKAAEIEEKYFSMFNDYLSRS